MLLTVVSIYCATCHFSPLLMLLLLLRLKMGTVFQKSILLSLKIKNHGN
jgi:hypothetical protein